MTKRDIQTTQAITRQETPGNGIITAISNQLWLLLFHDVEFKITNFEICAEFTQNSSTIRVVGRF